MKTSIFDATFTLPPLIEMTEVEKDMYEKTIYDLTCRTLNNLNPCPC